MKIGLKMNKTKTKANFNDKITSNEIKIDRKTLDVEEYIYLGKRMIKWRTTQAKCFIGSLTCFGCVDSVRCCIIS